MKCFYHPTADAVGMCSQCGKAACRGCIDDVGGALVCTGCITLARETSESEERQETAASVERARKHIRRAWIFGGIMGMFFLVVGMAGGNDPNPRSRPPAPWYILAPFAAYFWWGFYWGCFWFWPKWKRFVARIKGALSGWFIVARPAAWFTIFFFYIFFYFSVPLVMAIYYGAFGGGIYQYRKMKRLAAGAAQVAVA